jgi:hypothetical protein
MIQDPLAEPESAGVLTTEDLRGLTPLFWAHARPYSEVKLNMTTRLALSASQTDRPRRRQRPRRGQQVRPYSSLGATFPNGTPNSVD